MKVLSLDTKRPTDSDRSFRQTGLLRTDGANLINLISCTGFGDQMSKTQPKNSE